VGVGDWKTLLAERRDDAKLAIDRMGRGQQFAERLPAHHIGARRRVQTIRRIGLATLELQHCQGSGKALDMVDHPGGELGLVDPMALLDRLGAGKIFVLPHGISHDGAPLNAYLVGWAKQRWCPKGAALCAHYLPEP